ncbi:EboA domain-containing protein [Pedobacter aquatilis]|uniref:EboA domain-containing protein n=1 Tax=Pedobacter aquatilis TaxID=351343 RepID=UPI00292F5C40|nr:EboA domain-containing protein [Pedobacter aquatilis]
MAISDFGNTDNLLLNIIKDNTDDNAFAWLKTAGEATAVNKLGQAFVMLPRKTGKAGLKVSAEQQSALEAAGFGYINKWTIDQLARVWLLGKQSFEAAEQAHPVIENLFLSAEMNEAVALYSALPFLTKPESWAMRCAEGIRSNIGSVLEAIMENNPYPAKYLGEAAWNQLVLKAFFTEKAIDKIAGIGERANKPLALTLSDYARERYAAGREVNPRLWRFMAPFINDEIFEAIKIGLTKPDQAAQEAIVLAIAKSDYQPAKVYISQIPELSHLSK